MNSLLSKTIPKIRFKGFSGGWKEKRLGDFGSVKMCKRIFKEQTNDIGDIPFFKISTFGGIADSYISKDIYDKYIYEYPYPKKGDILISASGTIGKMVIYNGEKAYYQDSNIIWLQHNRTKLSNLFLHQILQYKNWTMIEGSTIKRLYNSILLSSKFFIPSLQEQTQIGNFFQKLDEFIELQQKTFEQIQTYKKAMLQKMFPQQGETVPQMRFKGFSEDWIKEKFVDVLLFSKGKQKNKEQLNKKGMFPVINGGMTFSGYTDEYNRPENTVVISEGGNSCGYIQFIRSKFWCGGHCYSIDKSSLHYLFLYPLLKNQELKIMQLRVGSGLPNIQRRALECVQFFYPSSVKEQIQISNFFQKLDDLIEQHKFRLEHYKTFKKAMLQRLFV